ncbi:MAG: hypothetical protein H7Z72_21265 [Bacteroidetes bacterium]|nr:hypothetical protein [Fibrella sp.]
MVAQEQPADDEGFGQKLLSFFIKEEPLAAGQQPPAPSRPAAAPVPLATAPSQSVAVPGSVDTKFLEHFAAVLGKANLPGPDYFEFRDILRSLANLGLSEDKQYQAAWASFKAMSGGGADVALLTSTANQYLTALNTDRDAFLKSADSALSEKIGGLQNEQTQLQRDNDALAKQIADLQQRLSKNVERLAKIGGELEEQSQKIAQNKANYDATFTTVTEQIKTDVAKIGSHLKS